MTSKVVAVALALFFMGCGTVKASTDGPWSEYIHDKDQLTDCQKAEQSYNIAIALDAKFQSMSEDPKVSPELKTVISAEQAGLWQLENELKSWAETNCKKA